MEHTGYRKFLKKVQQRVVPERTASDCWSLLGVRFAKMHLLCYPITTGSIR